MLMYLVSLLDNIKENKENRENEFRESLRSLRTATYAIRLNSGRYVFGCVEEES
jgi:hypothetical protein